MEPPRPQGARWVRGVVVGFVVFELLAGAALVAGVGRDAVAPPPPTALATTAAPPGTRQDSVDRSESLRTAAVEEVLAQRARAIRSRDRASFAKTLDRRQRAFSQRQLDTFDALKDVPLAEWRYEVDASDVRKPPAKYRDEAWAPRVTLRYRLAGFDAAPATSAAFFTFVRRGDGWLIADDADFEADENRRTERNVWDYGPVSVVRGARSLVLGHPGRHALLRDVARHADEAVPRVDAVWTGRWQRKVVVIVPNDQDEASGILGDDDDLTRIAAVAIAELPAQPGESPVGNRIIVNPPNFGRLGRLGRRVVMTHEVTHVATRDASAVGMPSWLVEGFADYVGYLGTGLSPRAICQELAADVRAGRAPRMLPSQMDFDGGNENLAQAYEAAWLAVRLVAERAGEDGLVRLYRRAATKPLPFVLQDVVGLSVPEFTEEWRAYVRRTLA